MKTAALDFTSARLGGRVSKAAVPVLFVLAGLSFLVSMADFKINSTEVRAHFLYSYLTAFMFYLTISLGALFFVMVHHLTGARWIVVLRRLAEILMMNLPLMAVLMIPILAWMPFIYPWAGKGSENAAALGKAAWLNSPFFTTRAFIYWIIWIGLASLLHRLSIRQDETGNPALASRMQRWSAPGMLLFAITITGAAFDWLMSLTPAWTSTIFGVYLFAGAVLAFLAAVILLAMALATLGPLRSAITVEHDHDLGKLLFAFVIFWAYIAFSQLLLIWMGAIPEETVWYQRRWQSPEWRAVSLFLLVGHFAAPMLFLLPRAIKRNRPALALAALWLLAAHYVDLYWLIMPAHETARARPALSDGALMAAMGTLFAAFTLWRLRRHPLVPIRDPHLAQSVEFENV